MSGEPVASASTRAQRLEFRRVESATQRWSRKSKPGFAFNPLDGKTVGVLAKDLGKDRTLPTNVVCASHGRGLASLTHTYASLFHVK